MRGRLAINAFRSAAAHILPGVIAQLTEHPMILGDFTCWAIVHEELRERDALGSR